MTRVAAGLQMMKIRRKEKYYKCSVAMVEATG
jgi:hypothetical protein